MGVWFPDDPQQVPWERFLDEVSEAGYEWIELGPYGYLPTDPAHLADETARRNLAVSAGTVFTGLHHGPAVWDRTWEHVAGVAALTRAMGAGHLVVIPSFWRDDKTGEVLEDRTLTAAQWRDLTTQTERLAREVRDRYGLRIVVHPHADTHIDGEENVNRFLDATDPELVSSASTRATTRTAAGTASNSSGPTASGSAICTSSRSTRRCSPMSWRTRFRSARPWRAV